MNYDKRKKKYCLYNSNTVNKKIYIFTIYKVIKELVYQVKKQYVNKFVKKY